MATKSLRVTVIDASRLPAADSNGFSDPYCCVALQQGPRAKKFDHKHCHTKTRIIKKVNVLAAVLIFV